MNIIQLIEKYGAEDINDLDRMFEQVENYKEQLQEKNKKLKKENKELKFTQNKLAIKELEYIYTYPFNLYSDGPEWLISRKDLEIKIKELIRRLERK